MEPPGEWRRLERADRRTPIQEHDEPPGRRRRGKLQRDDRRRQYHAFHARLRASLPVTGAQARAHSRRKTSTRGCRASSWPSRVGEHHDLVRTRACGPWPISARKRWWATGLVRPYDELTKVICACASIAMAATATERDAMRGAYAWSAGVRMNALSVRVLRRFGYRIDLGRVHFRLGRRGATCHERDRNN